MGEKAAFVTYLAVLAASPLLFGAVHTWVYTIVFLAVLTASAMLVLTRGMEDTAGLAPLYAAFIVFLIFQMTPLPGALTVKLSPAAKIAGDMSMPASAAVAGGGKALWFTLSPYVYPVRQSLIRWIVYGLFFFGLTQVLRSRRRIETAVMVILAVGCFEALYGIVQTYSGSQRIWWFKGFAGHLDVCGTYINRNHFAGFMEMGIILAVAYAGTFTAQGHSGRSGGATGAAGFAVRPRMKAFLLKYLSGEQIFTRQFLVIFSGVIMGIGLLLSASRGGIIAAAGGLFLMGLFFMLRKEERNKGIIILILFVLTAAYAFHIGIDYTLGRFREIDVGFETRTRYVHGALEMFSDYKLTGVGAGNFVHAFPKFQDMKDAGAFIDYAHNDWVQLLAETGIIGCLLLAGGMGYYAFRTISVWRRRRDPFAAGLGIAPPAVLTAIGIHSYSDFNLHIPANVFILAAVMAIGCSALHVKRDGHRREGADSFSGKSPQPPFLKGGQGRILSTSVTAGNHERFIAGFVRGKRMIPVILAFVLIIWSGVWIVRHFVAEAYCSTGINSPLNLQQNPSLPRIGNAIAWDGANADYHYRMARSMMAERDREARNSPAGDAPAGRVASPGSPGPIIAALEEAVRLNPLMPEYHVRLGWEYTYRWRDKEYMKRWLPAADLSMERAAYFSGKSAQNPHLHVDTGNYWTMRSRSLPENSAESKAAWMRAVWHYRMALMPMEKRGVKEEIDRYVKNFYPGDDPIHHNTLLMVD